MTSVWSRKSWAVPFLVGENTPPHTPLHLSLVREPCPFLKGGKKAGKEPGRAKGLHSARTPASKPNTARLPLPWQRCRDQHGSDTGKHSTANAAWELRDTLILFLSHLFPNLSFCLTDKSVLPNSSFSYLSVTSSDQDNQSWARLPAGSRAGLPAGKQGRLPLPFMSLGKSQSLYVSCLPLRVARSLAGWFLLPV